MSRGLPSQAMVMIQVIVCCAGRPALLRVWNADEKPPTWHGDSVTIVCYTDDAQCWAGLEGPVAGCVAIVAPSANDNCSSSFSLDHAQMR